MRQPSRGNFMAVVVAAALYGVLGLGYHRATVACYDSRHSIDKEPIIGGGAGVIVNVLLWPMFQSFTAVTQDVSCEPRPLG